MTNNPSISIYLVAFHGIENIIIYKNNNKGVAMKVLKVSVLIAMFFAGLGLGCLVGIRSEQGKPKNKCEWDKPNISKELKELEIESDDSDSMSMALQHELNIVREQLEVAKRDNDRLANGFAEQRAEVVRLKRLINGENESPLVEEEDTPELRAVWAEDYLEGMDVRATMETSLEAISAQFGSTIPESKREEYLKIYSDIFGWDKIGPKFLKIYTDVFTANELQELARFHKSKVGQVLKERQAELTQQTMKVMQELTTGAEFQKLIQEVSKLQAKP